MAVDPLTAKILAKVAVQAATDSESRKRILFMILAPVLGLLLMLFTWPILEQFTPEKVKDLISYYRVHKKPMIELANGWYHIEILGGETLQDGDYEPTFEFVIQPATNEEATINADMNFSFEITSSAY